MKLKNVSVNTLVILIFLFMINQILITSISTYFNTKEPMYELSKKAIDLKINYKDLNLIEDALNSDIVITGRAKADLASYSNKKEVEIKGVYGNYENYFKSGIQSGRFIKDSYDGENNAIVISSKIARNLFNQDEAVGLEIKKNGLRSEIVGVYGKNAFDMLAPEEAAYIHLAEMVDTEGFVQIEAIYINKKDKAGADIQEDYIASVLNNYGIDPDTYIIKDIDKKTNSIHTMESVLVFFMAFFLIKDIANSIVQRIKSLILHTKNNGVKNLAKEKVSIEIVIVVSCFVFMRYLFGTINYEHLPVDLILKEDVITCKFYEENFKKIWFDLFHMSNVYITSKYYFLNLITTIATVNYIICGVLLYFQRRYRGSNMDYKHVWIVTSTFACICARLSFKYRINFMPDTNIVILFGLTMFMEQLCGNSDEPS